MEDLTLMQKFADPQLIDNLTQIERTEGALITTLMGMGITFIVLALLWVMIAILTKVIQQSEVKAAMQVTIPHAQASVPASPPTPTPALSDVVATQTDTALIAVITAAIAAAEGSSVAENLVIRKINRISGASTAWSNAGSSERIDSRRF